MDQLRPEVAASGPRRRLRRGLDVTALWQLAVLVVVWAGGAVILWLIADLVRPSTGVEGRTVIIVWTALGVLVFVPPIELVLARVMLGLRRPTPDQLGVLQSAWDRVCAQAGVRGERYVLRIQPARTLNASAGAGHIVGVTTTALALHPRQLEAILAHELGHHLGGHAMIGLLHTWYSWPVRTLVRLAMWAVRMASLLLTLARPLSGLLTMVLLPVMMALSCLGSVLVMLVGLPVSVSIVVMRRSELRADATAVRLGYGGELLALYRGWAAYEPPRPGPWRSMKLFFRNTHPRFDVRVRNIERILADALP